MRNLYSITLNQAAIIARFRVINRYVGNPAANHGRVSRPPWVGHITAAHRRAVASTDGLRCCIAKQLPSDGAARPVRMEDSHFQSPWRKINIGGGPVLKVVAPDDGRTSTEAALD